MFYTLFHKLCADKIHCVNYFRMSKTTYEELLSYIENTESDLEKVSNTTAPLDTSEKLSEFVLIWGQ